MNTELVKIKKLKINEANPRSISTSKFDKLINSILVLPQMLKIRPVVVDEKYVILGGNMRYRALSEIATYQINDIIQRLQGLNDFAKKTKVEQDLLVDFWTGWLKGQEVEVIKASELSEDQKKAFIIKDNVGFGDWDYDVLANEWDSQELDEWGVDVWQMYQEEHDLTTNVTDDTTPTKAQENTGMEKLTFQLSTQNYTRVIDQLKAFDEDLNVALVKALGL